LTRATWIQHGGEVPWAQKIAAQLSSFGVDVQFVANLAEGHEAFVKNGFDSTFISPIAFDTSEGVSPVDIRVADETYGPPFVKAIVDSDVHLGLLFGKDERAKEAVVVRAYRFWESYLNREGTDCILLRETQSFATRTAYNVARRMGWPYVLKFDIGPSDDWFTLSDVGEEICSSELLQTLNEGVRDVTPEARRRVDELVAGRVGARTGLMSQRDPGLPLYKLLPHLLREKVWERRVDVANDPIQVAAHRLRRAFLRERAQARLRLERFPYERPSEQPYVFFPLYFQKEGMTLATLRFWAHNLVPLVREVARSLPSGYRLLIKEHPQVPGDVSLRQLNQLRRIPGVTLLYPLLQSREIMRRAEAVFVLQGTAGWEAFLMRRPLVVFGSDTYYSRSRLVYTTKDVSDLQSAFRDALREGLQQYRENESEWYWFVDCVLRSSLPGSFFHYEFPPFTDEELASVAAGLAQKILRSSALEG
jgi:hypothetical protein